MYLYHDFNSIINSIVTDFNPQQIKNEGHLEKLLMEFLLSRYPGRIEHQVRNPNGIIDVVIDACYGIELKIVRDKGILRNLVGQALFYKKYYKEVSILLFLDSKAVSNIDIEDYVKDLENIGIKVIVKRGRLTKRSNNKY